MSADIIQITHGEVLAMSPAEKRQYACSLLNLFRGMHERQLDTEHAADAIEEMRDGWIRGEEPRS